MSCLFLCSVSQPVGFGASSHSGNSQQPTVQSPEKHLGGSAEHSLNIIHILAEENFLPLISAINNHTDKQTNYLKELKFYFDIVCSHLYYFHVDSQLLSGKQAK